MQTLISPWLCRIACLSAVVVSGCATYRVDAVFTQPALKTYVRHTMFGLPPEREQVLMAAYLRAFPGQGRTFIERRRLQDVLEEQDILPGRLDRERRADIARILGVEAIVFAFHEEKSAASRRTESLTIRIVDAETGEISGSVIVTARSAGEIRAATLSEKAVAALKADLARTQSSGAPPPEQLTGPALPPAPRKLSPSEESLRRGMRIF